MIKFKSAPTPLGGPIQLDDIAPNLGYFPLKPAPAYTESMWSYKPTTEIVPNYIPVSEAVFSKTIYRGFYIQNTGEDTKTNIHFWINGGESFQVKNSPSYIRTLHEAAPFLDTEDTEDSLYDGKSRTSLFGQVNVGVFIGPERELVEFESDGDSAGINLRFLEFTTSSEKISIPDLGPGEYYGIYVKFTTKFVPSLGEPNDYCFLHASWLDPSGRRNVYPGQPKNNTSIILSGLPSVYVKFTTNFSKLNEYLRQDVQNLYDRYPPFFVRHDEVSDE